MDELTAEEQAYLNKTHKRAAEARRARERQAMLAGEVTG